MFPVWISQVIFFLIGELTTITLLSRVLPCILIDVFFIIIRLIVSWKRAQYTRLFYQTTHDGFSLSVFCLAWLEARQWTSLISSHEHVFGKKKKKPQGVLKFVSERGLSVVNVHIHILDFWAQPINFIVCCCYRRKLRLNKCQTFL